ncbi:MAG: M48 family metallopeptidase [Candidatus Omnitrophota bacterium]
MENHENKLKIKSREYSTIKYSLSIIEVIYVLLLLAVFLAGGFSVFLVKNLKLLLTGNFSTLAAYLIIIYAVYYILSFPLDFYHGFILDHQFKLSRQSLKGWFLDQLKAGIIFYIISLILLEVFRVLLSSQPNNWWWIISLFWIFLSLILAKLTPVLIIPLFFKYKKISNEDLRQRIIRLADKMNLKILDVFEINLSSKTEKGNAALVGFGNTRRVILGDTLKDRYVPEEIEVILAHEFAHQKLGHLLKLILSGSMSAVFCFYLIYKTSPRVLGFFGLNSLNDIAALPVVFIYLVLLGAVFQPWSNFLSRKFEIEADRLAISITGLNVAFISTMNKLAAQNLADRNPGFLIKFFFFDHPPIEERIKLAHKN